MPDGDGANEDLLNAEASSSPTPDDVGPNEDPIMSVRASLQQIRDQTAAVEIPKQSLAEFVDDGDKRKTDVIEVWMVDFA